MAAELTFAPGHVPGLSRTPRHSVRRAVHAAAPVSQQPDDIPLGMTAEQRRALTALIHTPAGPVQSKPAAADIVAGVVWALVTASALAWTLTIAVELAPDLGFVRNVEVPRVAMPHVTEESRAVV